MTVSTPSASELSARLRKAVLAYDAKRREGTSEPPMSAKNMETIEPMIGAAIDAFLSDASQAKRIEELEGVLDEAISALAYCERGAPSGSEEEANLRATLTKIREATK